MSESPATDYPRGVTRADPRRPAGAAGGPRPSRRWPTDPDGRSEYCTVGEVAVFQALIAGHLAWDRVHNKVGEHESDIHIFRNGLAKCNEYIETNCRCDCQLRPLTPQEQAYIAELLTAAAMLRYLIIILALA